jgi:plastocyanin
MKNKFIIILPVIVCAAVFSGCGKAKPVNPPPTAAPVQPPAVTQAKAQSAAVKISNFSFLPVELKIKEGMTVVFTNYDTAPHQIAFDQGVVPDSNVITTGNSYSYTFVNKGVFNYFCKIHPSMKGKIIVE